MISLLLIVFCAVNLFAVGRAMYKDRESFMHIVAVVKREQSFRSACFNTFLRWSLYLVFVVFHVSCVVYLSYGYCR